VASFSQIFYHNPISEHCHLDTQNVLMYYLTKVQPISGKPFNLRCSGTQATKLLLGVLKMK